MAQEVIPTAAAAPAFVWKIKNFSKLTSESLYSHVFVAGGYEWRLLVFPKVHGHLSLYLVDVDLSSKETESFSITVINQIRALDSIIKVAAKVRFHAFNPDWGFKAFMRLEKLHDPAEGYLIDDTLVVEARLCIPAPPLPRLLFHPENDRPLHFVTVKVSRDEDLKEQMGRDVYFDMVDHDKVCSFHVSQETPFHVFKEKAAMEFGVPVQFLRFWSWAKRQNGTYRLDQCLTSQQEEKTVEQLRWPLDKKQNLNLFLEVELGLDLHPIAPPAKTKDDILIFFKLYDSDKIELRYVGRLFVSRSSLLIETLGKLNQMAGFACDEEIELYEEISLYRKINCKHLDKMTSFDQNEIEDGDIICFQKSLSLEIQKQRFYPDVPSFFKYVLSRLRVHFRSLDSPNDDEFCLELSKSYTYDEVVERVAKRIGLDDPSKLRLTTHNSSSQAPRSTPILYRGVNNLSDMLYFTETSDILYYEVLDIPLPEMEGLKNLKVAFHPTTNDEVVIHNIRVSKHGTMQDVVNELKKTVKLSHPNAELRILEDTYHYIQRVFPLDHKLYYINEWWIIRAEEIPEEDKYHGPHDRLIQVCHFTDVFKVNRARVRMFGKPFFLVIHQGETLAEVKVRLQKKLQVHDEEFAKWKFAYVMRGVDHPQYLQRSDVLLSYFQRRDADGGGSGFFLGLEHSTDAMKQPHTINQKLMAHEVMPTSSTSPSTVKGTSFTWVINNFTKSNTKKLSSDVFIACGYKWRLFVDPKGNNRNILWVFLEAVDSIDLPTNWSINVQVSLSLVNQILDEDSIKKYGECKFCAGQTDWGCQYFLPLREFGKGYLVNDTVIIQIDVSAESTFRTWKRKIFQTSTPPDTPFASFASSLTSTQALYTLLEKSTDLLKELSILKITQISASASSSGTSGSGLQQHKKALKDYLALSLEAIDGANAFDEIKKIALLLLQHSANLFEITILKDLVSRLADLKEIVPATKSSIESMRAQKLYFSGKKAEIRARLNKGQELLLSLEVEFSKLLDEERELEPQVVYLIVEKDELLIRKRRVALDLEKTNEQVSNDLEEWRDMSKDIEQAAKAWLEAREKLAQANLSWQLFKQNLELCES